MFKNILTIALLLCCCGMFHGGRAARRGYGYQSYQSHSGYQGYQSYGFYRGGGCS